MTATTAPPHGLASRAVDNNETYSHKFARFAIRNNRSLALALTIASRDTHCVAFNSATGIGVPIESADNRQQGGFFTSVYHYWCVQFMAGRSGGVLARAGFRFTGTPTLLRACHPRLASIGGPLPESEATMPNTALRAFTTHAFTSFAAVLTHAGEPVAALTLPDGSEVQHGQA
ncbi:hypothetical protein [Jeongeupia sp. HS-3]|uniref:hypothetical protein n=1 Tax=Jeongeupia sp. HS-3 TaxID=1009682 RepID=UPI0019100EE4|nr:hypothetical protein [Jeongeupia sp. HS-3]